MPFKVSRMCSVKQNPHKGSCAVQADGGAAERCWHTIADVRALTRHVQHTEPTAVHALPDYVQSGDAHARLALLGDMQRHVVQRTYHLWTLM